MVMYLCKNKTNCDKADRSELVDIAPGATEKCPECGMTMKPAAGGRPDVAPGAAANSNDDGTGPPLMLMGAIAAVVIAVAGSTGYAFRCKIPVLGAKFCAASVIKTTPASASRPDGEAPVRAQSSQSEQSAKNNCERAVEQVDLDRLKICNRANAITLSNSGTLSATMGKLDDAERDYQAAIAKDPSFDGVYVNYAALKVRQGKNADAIGLLDTSVKNGFGPLDFIEQDPVFKPLFADPVWGKKLKDRIVASRASRSNPSPAGSKS